MSKIAIVIPTIRKKQIKKFLKEWKDEFRYCNVYVVWDTPKGWKEIEDDLGSKSWVVSKKNSGIRIYGFLKAYRDGADYIISLDDDCMPDTPDFVRKHIEALNKRVPTSWVYTLPSIYTRGFPYDIRRESQVMLNMGLWNGVPDLDAPTQLLTEITNYKNADNKSQVVPKGSYFPFCSMNFSFRRELTPHLYFPLMGMGQPYDRFDDIWAGVLVKRYLDKNNYAATFGRPYIRHERASNVYVNLQKEAKGLEVNEEFWKKMPKGNYFKQLGRAQKIWRLLFQQ